MPKQGKKPAGKGYPKGKPRSTTKRPAKKSKPYGLARQGLASQIRPAGCFRLVTPPGCVLVGVSNWNPIAPSFDFDEG